MYVARSMFLASMLKLNISIIILILFELAAELIINGSKCRGKIIKTVRIFDRKLLKMQ